MRKLIIIMTVCASLSSFAGVLDTQDNGSLIKKSTNSTILKFREPFREP